MCPYPNTNPPIQVVSTGRNVSILSVSRYNIQGREYYGVMVNIENLGTPAAMMMSETQLCLAIPPNDIDDITTIQNTEYHLLDFDYHCTFVASGVDIVGGVRTFMVALEING